jgi:hypothetical protein
MGSECHARGSYLFLVISVVVVVMVMRMMSSMVESVKSVNIVLDSPKSPSSPRSIEFRRLVLTRDSIDSRTEPISKGKNKKFYCVFCHGLYSELFVQAAHIIPHAANERLPIDTELSIGGIENISNGITLCKICHTAFDDGMDFYGLNQIFKLKQMKPREIYVWMKNLSQSIISIIWIYIMVVVSYVGLRIPVYIIYSLLNLFGIGKRKGKERIGQY